MNPLPPQAGWQIAPLPVASTPCCCRPGVTQNFAVAVAGTLSPHPRLNLYFGGLLIKLEHLGDFRNWTLVLRNSSDSNCRDAKCYRIGAVGGGVGLLLASESWDEAAGIGFGWYTRATCTPTS